MKSTKGNETWRRAVARIVKRMDLVARSAEHARAAAERGRMHAVISRQHGYPSTAAWERRTAHEEWRREALGSMAQEMANDALARMEKVAALAYVKAAARVRSVRAINKLHRDRAARRAVVDTLAARAPGHVLRLLATKRERLAEQARAAAAGPAVAAYKSCGYRRAESKWVGGDNTVGLQFGGAWVRSTISTVWHKKHTWKGTNLDVTLSVPENWLEAVHARGLAAVEGRFTLSARPLPAEENEDLLECVWVEQAKGLDLRSERGVLYRRRSRGAGSAWLPWVHAACERGARAVYARMLRAAAQVSA